MKIISYKYQDQRNGGGWKISKISLGKINLMVGISGSGKTRLLSTIFNLGTLAVGKDIKRGFWNVVIEQNGKKYDIMIESGLDKNGKISILREKIDQISSNFKSQLIKRDSKSFFFKGKKLPKLSMERSSIFLLKDENLIKPIYEGFSSIIKRDFSHGSSGEIAEIKFVDQEFYNKVKAQQIKEPFIAPEHLNIQLFVLKECFPNIYFKINEKYKDIFPFILSTNILDLKDLRKNLSLPPGKAPIFCIKEKNYKKWIPLSELSTGMQKVLIIITDLFSMSKNYVYLIDEYENSLGINSIDFLPSILSEHIEVSQFIITTHHPYIINNIPIKNWYVFYRSGEEVKIEYGDKLVKKYGKSKQQAFTKLINDPFYSEGIE